MIFSKLSLRTGFAGFIEVILSTAFLRYLFLTAIICYLQDCHCYCGEKSSFISIQHRPLIHFAPQKLFITFFFFALASIYISWRLISLQYCSGLCHTLTWISHVFTCSLLLWGKNDWKTCRFPLMVFLKLQAAPLEYRQHIKTGIVEIFLKWRTSIYFEPHLWKYC